MESKAKNCLSSRSTASFSNAAIREKVRALGAKFHVWRVHITLPVKRTQKKRETKTITWTSQSLPGTPIDCVLSTLGSIQLEVVTAQADIVLWNELVNRHHYSGYRHPISAALKYFIIANTPTRQILGCLQFSASVWHLADRDQWIGWQTKDREQRLNLIINNTRF